MTEHPTNLRLDNRRQGPDLWLKLLSWLNLLCWVLLIIALTIAHLAEPEFNSGLVRYWQIEIDLLWNQRLLHYSLLFFCGCLLMSVLTLVLDWRRSRRQTDSLRINLYLLAMFSVAALWLIDRLSTR